MFELRRRVGSCTLATVRTRRLNEATRETLHFLTQDEDDARFYVLKGAKQVARLCCCGRNLDGFQDGVALHFTRAWPEAYPVWMVCPRCEVRATRPVKHRPSSSGRRLGRIMLTGATNACSVFVTIR